MTVVDPLFDVAGKTVLITAAASGMGRAAMLMFAARGAHVIAVDLVKAGVEAVVAEVVAAGGTADAFTVDLTDMTATNAFIDTVLANYDVLDVLYNHAGLRGPVALDYDEESILTNVTINLMVPMILTKRLLPLLRKSPAASIIYTASTAGHISSVGLITYGATKAGLLNYMRSMAVTLGPEGIRVNAISPGATMTVGMKHNHSEEALAHISSFIPLRRLGEPEEDAAAALFLASAASSYVTGVVIVVDGGLTAS